MKISPQTQNLLLDLAGKYVWWKRPSEAVSQPQRVIAQVMDIGDYADVQRLAEIAGDAVLREALIHAEAGQFSERSWSYWHYRLGMSAPGKVPPMPARKLA